MCIMCIHMYTYFSILLSILKSMSLHYTFDSNLTLKRFVLILLSMFVKLLSMTVRNWAPCLCNQPCRAPWALIPHSRLTLHGHPPYPTQALDAQCQDVIFDLSRLQIPVVGHAFLCGHCMLSCLYTCTSSSRHSTCQSPHNADPPDSGKPTLGVDTRKRKKYMKRHFHVFNMPSEGAVAVRNILFLMMLY